ncbi:MAG: tetratricopeptide repeat protein [Kofleriaceae bacterium]|nr:tetratricopeptide repeat protein [Kofleriaceae bacterium]
MGRSRLAASSETKQFEADPAARPERREARGGSTQRASTGRTAGGVRTVAADGANRDRPTFRASRWLAAMLLCLPGAAAADIEGKLGLFEQESRQIAQTLPRPDNLTNVQPERRLVDAQTAYALGNFDDAALVLFELSSKPGNEQEAATFYLGEALFQKGDKGAARAYFGQIAQKPASKYHQQSLIRLVEIAIAQNDTTDIDATLSALDRSSPSSAQIPYVKGKWAFSQGKLDEAITLFQAVPKGSQWELQSLYYLGAVNVAKRDLARATELYTDLIGRRAKTAPERRVVELSQLALGRLYYERDQLAKSIDSYLLVDRHSDLFPEALYEVAWVYVKGKQFDKALRALELLALSEPTSNKTPTVRLLEGNLRIRKAQLLRQAIITNTVDAEHKDPVIEYDKAAAVFEETNRLYFPSYQSVATMLEGGTDAGDYIAQLAGRSSTVFQATAPIPEAAAQYLRDEPEVQRVVANQSDLGTIQAHLTEAEANVARLEAVLAADDKSVVYPGLASRRARIGQIQRELIDVRADLADQQLALIAQSGDVAQASGNRKTLLAQLQAMPDADAAHAAMLTEARDGYEKIDETVSEISGALDSSQAVAVALRTYVSTPPTEGMAAIAPEQKQTVNTELAATAAEAFAIEKELAEIRSELQLGRDLAGVGDASLAQAHDLRQQVMAAQDAEQRVLTGFASASRDRSKSSRLVGLADRAQKIATELDTTDRHINSIVDKALENAKATLAQEHKLIDEYKAELAEYEVESRAIGGTVLGASFQNVKAKFYDIVIRTDVGSIDVLWSQKEDADDDLKRLNLTQSRELKQLRDEFKDILDARMATPAQPAATPASSAPAVSPDKATGGENARVKPGGDAPKAPSAPTVRPDNETVTPTKGGKK